MSQNPRIDSVMTPAPHSIELEARVRDAEDRMIDHEIRHLPVVDGGTLVGLISDRDIAFLDNEPAEDLRDQLRVRDVCSLEVYTVEPDTHLDVVAAEMAERRIGSAVITDHGKVLGLFTSTDACRCLAGLLREEADAA